MAVGDLTATSVGDYPSGSAALVSAIDDLNLPAVTDMLFLIPIAGRDNMVRLIKVVRAAA